MAGTHFKQYCILLCSEAGQVCSSFSPFNDITMVTVIAATQVPFSHNVMVLCASWSLLYIVAMTRQLLQSSVQPNIE